jgi:chromosome condensin MukBEF ATPase and DNA-binding subunit MukB
VTGPALHLVQRARRYSVRLEGGQWFIMIGAEEAAVLPNWRGVIEALMHRPDTSGADYVSDRRLLQHVIDQLFVTKRDREVFRDTGSERRRQALEEVARLADECRWDGSAAQIVAQVRQ